jgi:nuclear pore complex protein Nup133
MHPRIQLILGGVLVVVQFGDAVALCARGKEDTLSFSLLQTSLADSDYRDRLELKSVADRTLGVCVIQSDSTFLLLTATLMMKAFIDVEKIQNFDPQCVLHYFEYSIFMLRVLKNRPHKSHQVDHDPSHLVRRNT